MQMTSRLQASRHGERRYLRDPVPLVFPTDEEVPEHKLHVELRTALYQLIQLALGDRVIVGSEQFVYFDAANPQRRLAPDVMVWAGAPDEIFGAWKVWERGAPHLAVEIVSPSDAPPGPWRKKLERYRQCGVSELVRFDPEAERERLRIWDRVEGDLVERDLTSPLGRYCDVLGLWWYVTEVPPFGTMLRLARDSAGTELLPTLAEARARAEAERQHAEAERQHAEAERQRAEAERQRAEAEKQRAEAEKQRAEARIQELEAELRTRR